MYRSRLRRIDEDVAHVGLHTAAMPIDNGQALTPQRTRASTHEDLRVWQRSIQLAVESYRVAHRLPESEQNGLASQLRRSATSVAANIAEGYGRSHRKDYIRFLAIARGSACEVDTHLEILLRIRMLREPEMLLARRLALDIRRMLSRMILSLRKSV